MSNSLQILLRRCDEQIVRVHAEQGVHFCMAVQLRFYSEPVPPAALQQGRKVILKRFWRGPQAIKRLLQLYSRQATCHTHMQALGRT
jgi:hypothetical protein